MSVDATDCARAQEAHRHLQQAEPHDDPHLLLSVSGIMYRWYAWQVFEIPVVNQTQFEVEENEYKEKRNNSVSATNESGMKLLHLVKGNKNEGPVRVTGFLDEFHQEASTDNLAGASSDGNGESPEGRVSVIERRVPSSSGANGEGERE